MPSAKPTFLWSLPLLLGACTSAAVEEPAAETASVVEVSFIEGAPTDRFVITNRGPCPLGEIALELDLSASAGGLIFDTLATGAGVEVFQPFEVEAGDIVPLADGVSDGDSSLSLRIGSLGAGDRASFTIDVDDTLPSSELGQIRVAGSEISGAIATIASPTETVVASFTEESLARVPVRCPKQTDKML